MTDAPTNGPSGLRPEPPRTGRYASALRSFRSVPRRVRIVVGVVTVVVIVGAGVADGLTRSSGPADQVTDKGTAHAFSLPSVADPNQTISLAGFSGRPLVLNFWGSWCAPCQQEMPLLASAARDEAGKVAFLGVDLEDTRAAAQGMIARFHVGYPSVFDPNDSLAAPYRVVGSPTTVFINSRGHIIGVVQGALTSARLDWWLVQLS